MPDVHRADDGQRVELDFVRRSVATWQTLVEGRLAALAPSELVVEVFGAVDAQAHQKVVFLEELAPRIVQQRAVGLEVVLDAFPLAYFFWSATTFR